jgi:hypothetical protein
VVELPHEDGELLAPAAAEISRATGDAGLLGSGEAGRRTARAGVTHGAAERLPESTAQACALFLPIRRWRRPPPLV